MSLPAWLSDYPSPEAYRLTKALAGTTTRIGDLAVLVRGVLRSESLKRRYSWDMDLPKELANRVSPLFDMAGLEFSRGSATRVRARPWKPSWLQSKEGVDIETAAFVRQARRPQESAPGDPILAALDLHDYTSTAQRDAVRAVLCARPPDTLAICLPTGSGKSICAFLPSILPMDAVNATAGVSLIIVPTVALGLDLERRLLARTGHPIAYRPNKAEEATAIRRRCEAGIQGPIIASPEALTGKLLSSLRLAAERNWLRYFAVDEAHMVLSWGDEFRPAFLHLAALRRDLLQRSSRGFVSLLLSATLTDYHLRWLRAMFSDGSSFHLVHAARLRPEPSFWVGRTDDEGQRRAWLEEAVFRLPRPCIIYTTRRDLCEHWYSRLEQLHFGRIGQMHGRTDDHARESLLARWNADEIDVVVATSAFGLGVDKGDVRTIIHAQLPESVDRYYQDVGRSGRDGLSSISLLVTSPEDAGDVAGIGKPKFISARYGLDRWTRMYQERKTLKTNPQTILVDLNAARELDMRGDYNRNWNVRTLQLLQRVGAIEFVSHDEEDYDHAAVQPKAVPHTDLAYWTSTVEPLRRELIGDYKKAQKLLHRLVSSDSTCFASHFRNCYAPRSFELDVVTACGGCPACRDSGSESTCGRIIARHLPPAPYPGTPPGEALSRFLRGRPLGMIYYPSTLEDQGSEKFADLLSWLCSQSVRNFVGSETVNKTLREVFERERHLVAFYHQKPPRGLDVTAAQPTAVIITKRPPGWWKEFYFSIGLRTTPTLIVGPADLTCPDHPGRMLRDVLDGPSISLAEWENRFVA